MGAMTNLLVKEDSTTPGEVTFVPVTDTPIPLWRAQAAGVPFDGQVRIQASWEKLKSGVYKAFLKLEVPVLETLGVSGTANGYVAQPKVAYTVTGNVTLFCDGRSTQADRANTLKMLVGLLQGATSSSGAGTLDQASAGDAFKSSTAPITSLFVNGIQPN